jgi:hypothetical protein
VRRGGSQSLASPQHRGYPTARDDRVIVRHTTLDTDVVDAVEVVVS